MAVIQIRTPDISQNVKTYLTSDYTSGSSLTVASSVAFASGNYAVIGQPGLENTEITDLTASPPDNTTLTVSALKFSHPKGTPVSYSNWNKYELSYRTTDAGAWNIYASMPTNLVFDALNTEYRDTAATSTYSWRYRYYSTENTAYSGYSDTLGASGWSRSSVGYMVREIRKIANDPESKTITDTEIIRFLNAAQDKIYTLYDRWWFLLKQGDNIASIASTKTYGLPSDFGRMHNVQFNYIAGANDITYNLAYLPMIEFDYATRDNNAADNDDLNYYGIYPPDSDNTVGYLRVWPKPETAGLNIIPWYYKTFTDLDSFADTTEVPIPDVLENYALAQIFKLRTEEKKADFYDAQFREQIELLKLMQRKNARPMRSLYKFKGVKAESRYFGTRNVYSDANRESFW